MDSELAKSFLHSEAFSAAGKALMTFGPIEAIHQHLCAFHTYAHDRTRQIEVHHYCTHLSENLNQCILYDSDKPDARLIGIEYIVSEKVFKTFSMEERKYWHSHSFEIASGKITYEVKGFVPHAIVNAVEKPILSELQTTYGKTIHTWAVDESPEFPLGPPYSMMSFTAPGQDNEGLIAARDKRYGMNTEELRKIRKEYLPSYEKVEGSDNWETSGKAILFKPVEVDVKQ